MIKIAEQLAEQMNQAGITPENTQMACSLVKTSNAWACWDDLGARCAMIVFNGGRWSARDGAAVEAN